MYAETFYLAIRFYYYSAPKLVGWAQNSVIKEKFLKGLVIPLPLNVIPLPARWKIKFLPAIELHYPPEAANDNEAVHEACAEIHEKMQAAILKELKNRKSIYL